jgi:CspA family cold shock protein
MSERQKGVVEWFNEEKGFSMIAPDDGGSNLFVHHKSLQVSGIKTIYEGQTVSFVIIQGQKGPEADEVRNE